MYHFVWADQREKQGYKCDVCIPEGRDTNGIPEGRDTNNLYPGDDATIYIGTTNPLLIVGLNLLIILSLCI